MFCKGCSFTSNSAIVMLSMVSRINFGQVRKPTRWTSVLHLGCEKTSLQSFKTFGFRAIVINSSTGITFTRYSVHEVRLENQKHSMTHKDIYGIYSRLLSASFGVNRTMLLKDSHLHLDSLGQMTI